MVRFIDKIVICVVLLVKLEDIQFDSFIGIVVVLQFDGILKVFEVYVFVFSLCGSGEGYWFWENVDGSVLIMINGMVGNLVVSQGWCMIVKYGDGEKIVVVLDDVFIVSLELGECSLFKFGVKVVLFLQKGVDGSFIVLVILVGKDGVILLM